MSLPMSRGRLAALAVAGAVACGFEVQTYAQAPSEPVKPTHEQKSQGARTSPKLYEDSEIRIHISPAGRFPEPIDHLAFLGQIIRG